ncbi:MAG: hypothetical protein Kapaf2KO_23410 [Candidatus Kapaibacteriales bacterium]
MNPSKKILCVDDEYLNLVLLEKILNRNHTVLTACNGDEALNILDQETNISYVFCDLKMPGMSGLDFINKAKDSTNKIKYFLVTGYAIDEEISHALDSGVILGYFQKPINPAEIRQVIQ